MKFKYLGKTINLKGVCESDWIYTKIKKTGTFYEMDLLKYIRYTMFGSPKGCILDVGANIGNHSVFFGMYIADRVVSFEPNPEVFPILCENLDNNSILYKAYMIGLGDRKMKARIEIPQDQMSNIGAAKCVEIQVGEFASSGVITITPLDSLLPEIESFLMGLKITAIKIDVEGMEAGVLGGGLKLLNKYKPDLFVEIGSFDLMKSVQSVLNPIGYRPITSWAATPVWHFVHKQKLTIVRMVYFKLYSLLYKGLKRFFGN